MSRGRPSDCSATAWRNCGRYRVRAIRRGYAAVPVPRRRKQFCPCARISRARHAWRAKDEANTNNDTLLARARVNARLGEHFAPPPSNREFDDIQIACRLLGPTPLHPNTKDKISMFCHVPPAQVVGIHDVSSVYHVPLLLRAQGIVEFLEKRLSLAELRRKLLNVFLNLWLKRYE